MKRVLIYLSNSHEIIVKYLMVLATIAVIVAMMPKEPKYKYNFQRGKPWAYDILIAPFDFPIHKSAEEIEEEREIALRNAPAYFRVDTNIAGQRLASYKSNYERSTGFPDDSLMQIRDRNLRQILENRRYQYEFGNKLLREVYNKGIVRLTEEFEVKPSDFEIMVVKNNVAEARELGEMYNIQGAYTYIENQIKKSERADVTYLMPLIEPALTHNVFYDQETTRQIQKDLADQISLVRGKIQEGERIISRGEVVDAEKYQILQSLKRETEGRIDITGGNPFILTGYIVLVSLALAMLFIFLALYRNDIYSDNSKILLILMQIVIMSAIFIWAVKVKLFSLYLVPFCIVPIVMRIFFDTRLALFIHIIIILILGVIAPNPFEFVYLQIIAGMVAIYSVIDLRNRSQLFISVGFILAAYAVSYLAFAFLHEGEFDKIDWVNLGWFGGNALITLFAFPLIYIYERIFGFVSEVSLMELSDLNSPLLRDLSLKAPGTFQHSLQVANLAQAAIYQVGGNSLLVRTGALYHDVGKMNMPLYFIENQSTQVNPHDELPFEESAKIIISHVIKGVELAKKYNLPEQVIDFIRTHHGTSMVQYFYQSFLKNYPDKIVDEEDFKYPGPLPYSKETAVLMMADSVEAASRSMKSVDKEVIERLVDNIIDNQIEQNQFINCDITFRDITRIKKIFKKMLMSIHHVRVEYPAV
jgi:cyclic-di-AMP phosphodiesterase PgpH